MIGSEMPYETTPQSAPPGPVRARLEAAFGVGTAWTPEAGGSAVAWKTPAYHLVWAAAAGTEAALRKVWEARKDRQAYPVVVLAPSDDASTVRVVGPQDAQPMRELPAGRVLDLLEASHDRKAREAAAFLTGEFTRLEEAVVPGLRVKDLLTPHFVRAPANAQRLRGAVTLGTGARADFESLRSRPVGVSLRAGILRPNPFSSSMGLRA